jgi:formate-dependent nitrite reductase cytochrome c552 subunit
MRFRNLIGMGVRLPSIAGLLCVGFLMGQQTGYQGIRETLPLAVAPQPVPFSHKRHAAARIKCADCHSNAQREERAGIPQASQCMVCHATIQKDAPAVREIARYAARREPIPWVRIYRLPDFVFFSHAVHSKAAVECQTCHGPVVEREVLQKEVSTGMRGCVECHRTRKAPVDCSRCHELGQ